MKIATFNVNNINKRLPNLLSWLATAEPDIVCLQELKAQQDAFPAGAIHAAGYMAEWVGQRSWNGVAILSRKHEIHVTRTQLPGEPSDTQSRYLEAAINGTLIGCIYVPNGNPQPGPKFDYKLAWFARLIEHARLLKSLRVPAGLVGDFNVVPTDLDIYPTKSWNNDALLQPRSRAAFQQLLQQGWVDAHRHLFPEKPMYTFWDYMRRRWENDKGLRLDLFLLSPELAMRLVDGGVDRSVRGQEGSSDHAPAWIDLR